MIDCCSGKSRYSTIQRKTKEAIKKNNKFVALAIIFLVGYFFYAQYDTYADSLASSSDGADAKKLTSGQIRACLWDNEFLESQDKESPISCENSHRCVEKRIKDGAAGRKAEKESLERELYEVVGESPIRQMVPYIARFDRKSAALIIGIARKESGWGEHVPTLNGEDCFNYWGFKGAGSRGTAMGHGCFATPEEAVRAIGNRIDNLISQSLDTPSEMIVWKCGSTCAGHDPQGVAKWISDVDIYYRRIAINS